MGRVHTQYVCQVALALDSSPRQAKVGQERVVLCRLFPRKIFEDLLSLVYEDAECPLVRIVFAICDNVFHD
jgi:hypothetical protein